MTSGEFSRMQPTRPILMNEHKNMVASKKLPSTGGDPEMTSINYDNSHGTSSYQISGTNMPCQQNPCVSSISIMDSFDDDGPILPVGPMGPTYMGGSRRSSISSDLMSFSEDSRDTSICGGDYEIDDDLCARLAARIAIGDLIPGTGPGYILRQKQIQNSSSFGPEDFGQDFDCGHLEIEDVEWDADINEQSQLREAPQPAALPSLRSTNAQDDLINAPMLMAIFSKGDPYQSESTAIKQHGTFIDKRIKLDGGHNGVTLEENFRMKTLAPGVPASSGPPTPPITHPTDNTKVVLTARPDSNPPIISTTRTGSSPPTVPTAHPGPLKIPTVRTGSSRPSITTARPGSGPRANPAGPGNNPSTLSTARPYIKGKGATTSSQRTHDRRARRLRAAGKLPPLVSQPSAKSLNLPDLEADNSVESDFSESSGGPAKALHVREIRIRNLPDNITLKTILSKVRGGILDRVCYRKGPGTLKLVFFDSSSARSFYHFTQRYPLSFPISDHPLSLLRPVEVVPCSEAFMSAVDTPNKNEAVLARGATRCFFMGFLPDTIGVEKIKTDIMARLARLQRNPRRLDDSDELIESIEIVPEPGKLKRIVSTPVWRNKGKTPGRKAGLCVIVRLASISLAFGAIGDFKSRSEYFGIELSYVEDECAAPLVPVWTSPIEEVRMFNSNSTVLGQQQSWSGGMPPPSRALPANPPRAPRAMGGSGEASTGPRMDHPNREVFLGSLPPFMTPKALADMIRLRGGQVDTMHLYKNPNHPCKEAVIFFITHEAARRFYNSITTHALTVSGRKVFALTVIPDRVKVMHDPRSFLQGQSANGITRFVKISGVSSHRQLLKDIGELYGQQLVVDTWRKSKDNDTASDLTLQFMGMREAVRVFGSLKRLPSYCSLPCTYVQDPCGVLQGTN